MCFCFFFFQAEDGIRGAQESRGLGDVYKRQGQTLDAVVIGFDKDGKRVDLSIKRLTQDPFEAISEKYAVDAAVSGKITHVGSMGVDIELEDLSLIHI
mgnify:CR=1 FL=1